MKNRAHEELECEWYEKRGILDPAAPPTIEHLKTCQRCRARNEQIERLILDVQLDVAEQRRKLPVGWERKVWSRMEAPVARTLPRWALAGAGTAVLAGAMAFVVWPRGGALDELNPVVAMHGERGEGPVTRGETRPGDWLVVEAGGLGKRPAELRVYRDGDLVGACRDRPPCERRGPRLRGRFLLETRGGYRAVVVTADGELPPTSSRGYAEDQKRVDAARATVVSAAMLDVL